MLLLQREPTNVKDNQAVSVMKNALVVGHVPCNFAALFSRFLSRTCNRGVAEVTGTKVNRGAGYGLEVPCNYRLYGPAPYLDRLKQIISEEQN